MNPLNPLEAADWDAQLALLPGARFFHSASWARVLHDTYGYQPLYLANREGGRMTSLLPLMEVASSLTGRRGVSLPFTDAVEPLCADQASFQALFSTARSLAAEKNWKYLECRGGRRWLPDAPASISFHNHVLALNPDEAALFKGFAEPVRRAVRKGEKSGLTLEFSRDLSALETFFSLMCKTRRRHGVPPQPFAFFAAIQRHVLAAGYGWVVLARQNQTPVAGAVFFHYGRDAIYKFGASDEAYQQLRGNNLVMAEAIRRYAREGFATFDFGRTSLDHEGLRKFKLGWGAREDLVEYVRYDRRTNAFVTARDESSGWHTRIFNALPLPLSRSIGAVLYRHMG